MTEEQAEALRRLSLLRQKSQAALLRDALGTLIDQQDRSRRIERARRCIGAYRSGTSDTSVDHDAALDDAFGV
jgi:hypothetical protein